MSLFSTFINDKKCMIKTRIILLLFFFSFKLLYSQESFFKKGLELFDDEQFILAQSYFEKINTDQALFYNAECSKILFLDDAEFLYEKLLFDYPESVLNHNANIALAEINFRKKNYLKSCRYYSIELNYLNDSQIFNLAYSYFASDSLVKSKLFFKKLLNSSNSCAAAAQYYYAHIAYQNKDFISSLEWFLKLEGKTKFSDIIPYYIAQIYYQKKEYKKLILFLESKVDNIINSRTTEVNRLLAESYYHLENYDRAIKYFNLYFSNNNSFVKQEYYMLAFSYFKSLDNVNAIKFFEKSLGQNDTLDQISSYYLGASYLKMNNKKYSLNAFKKSSQFNINPSLKDDALFNYAKLSYELDLPYNNTLEIFKKFINESNSQPKIDTIQTLMANVLRGTSNYLKAYNGLKSLGSHTKEQKIIMQELAYFLAINEFNNSNYKNAIDFFIQSNNFKVNLDIYYLSNFWMADALYMLDDFEKAKSIYEKIGFNDKLSSYISNAKYNLAYCYFQTKEFKESNSLFRSFIKNCKDSSMLNDAFLRIADCFYMQNEFLLSQKYYEKSIKLNLFDVDYALYNSSLCLSLINQKSKKLTMLKRLVKDFYNSPYYDNALFDLANNFKNNNDFQLAISYYDSVLKNSADLSLRAESYLGRGIINFNNNKTDEAIDDYTFVIENFSKTKYFKQALLGIQSIYVANAQVDKYVDLINSLPNFNVNKSEIDSLSYNAAFIKFSEGEYVYSRDNFINYLNDFSKIHNSSVEHDGVFVNQANYFLAESYRRLSDSLNAFLYYENIIKSNSKEYLEVALMFCARHKYRLKEYSSSNLYYLAIEGIASSNSLRREAIIRLMYGFNFLENNSAFVYAQKVLSLDKNDNWLISIANTIIAREEFLRGNYLKVRINYKTVLDINLGSEAAEAKYMLSYLTFLDNDLELAEKMIFELAENYSNDYFIAKAFILLSDIYIEKNDLFQAKATLESVIDNHNGSELRLLAQKKRENILEKELALNSVSEKSTNEYLDLNLDYELIFEEESENEEY